MAIGRKANALTKKSAGENALGIGSPKWRAEESAENSASGSTSLWKQCRRGSPTHISALSSATVIEFFCAHPLPKSRLLHRWLPRAARNMQKPCCVAIVSSLGKQKVGYGMVVDGFAKFQALKSKFQGLKFGDSNFWPQKHCDVLSPSFSKPF